MHLSLGYILMVDKCDPKGIKWICENVFLPVKTKQIFSLVNDESNIFQI